MFSLTSSCDASIFLLFLTDIASMLRLMGCQIQSHMNCSARITRKLCFVPGWTSATAQSSVRLNLLSSDLIYFPFKLTIFTIDNNPLPASGPADLITYDSHGCPMLPKIDMLKATVEDMRQTLITYLDKQWGMFKHFCLPRI